MKVWEGVGTGLGSSGENISQGIAHVCSACSVTECDPNGLLCPSITGSPVPPLRRGDSLSGN